MCRRSAGGPGPEAAARLGEASQSRPLLAGPLEFGLRLPRPDSGTAIGSDHYVVVTGVGLEPWQQDHLGYFAIRVGAMQHPLVTGDHITLARLLRRLAPTHEQLRASLPGG